MGTLALEEGLFLTRFATSVTIIHRRDSFRAGAILQKRAQDNPKIKFIWNTVVTDVIGEDKVELIKIKNLQTGEVTSSRRMACSFLSVIPPTRRCSPVNWKWRMVTSKVNDRMHTSVPGVFAAGESADPHFKQVITSAGMGAAAAMEATRFLEQEAG